MSLIDKLKFDYGQARAERERWEPYYQAAYRITFPERATSLGLTIDDGAYIFDVAVKEAVRLFSSAAVTGIMPTGLSWLEAVPNKGKKVSKQTLEWLAAFSDIAMQYTEDSNLSSLKLEYMNDITVSGIAGLYCDFETENNRLIFENWRIEQMYVARSTGYVVDTVFRDTPLTLSQVMNRGFKLSPVMQENHEDESFDRTQTYPIVHAIAPRKHGVIGGFSDRLPFMSTYFLPDEGFILSDSGYEEFPGAIGRWKLLPNSEYAVGPVHEVIPTFSALNETQDLMVQNLDIQVKPALVVADDGVINTRSLTLDSESILVARDTSNIKRLGTETNLPYALELKRDLRDQIRSLMMTDQLLPLDRPNATATEVRTRQLLIRRILGPTYSRLENETLPGVGARIFGLLMRNGKAPEMPDIVRNELVDESGGISFATKFVNDNTRSQNSEELANINDFEAGISVSAQVDPQVRDVYNFDKAATLKSQLLSVPPELINSSEEIADIREERQEQLRQQREAELRTEQAKRSPQQ